MLPFSMKKYKDMFFFPYICPALLSWVWLFSLFTGFSRQIVQILKDHSIQYSSFDILSDDEVRQALKTYSNWPTYPQIYVNGELVGGLDILKVGFTDSWGVTVRVLVINRYRQYRALRVKLRSEQRICVPLYRRLECNWQMKRRNFIIIFRWHVPVTMQHFFHQQMSLF